MHFLYALKFKGVAIPKLSPDFYHRFIPKILLMNREVAHAAGLSINGH